MTHRHFCTGLRSSAIILATAGMTPAIAQESRDQRLDARNAQAFSDLRRSIDGAEAARIAGLCSIRDERLALAERQLARRIARSPYGASFYSEDAADIERAKKLPCPVPAPVPPPAQEVLANPADPPVSEPTDLPSPIQSDVAAAQSQQRRLGEIERKLIIAEEQRLAGNCGGRNATLDIVQNAATLADVPPDVRGSALRRVGAIGRRPCPPGDASYNTVQIAGGYGDSSIPRGNYGFLRDGPVPTPEVPALRSERRNPGLAVDAVTVFRGIGRFNLGFREGDSRNSADFALGPVGTARGFPYTDNSPSGSTGIAGNIPMAVTSEVDVQEYSGGYRIELGQLIGRDGPPGPVQAHVGVTINYRERDHRGMVSIVTPVIANQSLDQRIDELEIGFVAGARAVVPLGTSARFTLGGEIGVFAYDFDLESLETVSQNFGPLNDRAFTTRITDDKKGIGYGGDAFAEFAVNLTPSLEAFAMGDASFFSDRGQLVNPPNGDFVLNGGSTFLRTDSGVDLRIMVGLRAQFGRAP